MVCGVGWVYNLYYIYIYSFIVVALSIIFFFRLLFAFMGYKFTYNLLSTYNSQHLLLSVLCSLTIYSFVLYLFFYNLQFLFTCYLLYVTATSSHQTTYPTSVTSVLTIASTYTLFSHKHKAKVRIIKIQYSYPMELKRQDTEFLESFLVLMKIQHYLDII